MWLAVICLYSSFASLDSLGAQSAPYMSLGKPVWTSRAPFDRISGLRLLSTGKVIVSDRRSAQVWLLNESGERISVMGRKGAGPGEYRSPGEVVPMSADSSIVIDRGLHRFLQLGPDGEPVGAFSYPAGFGDGPTATRAVDGRGRLIFPASAWGVGGKPLVPLIAWDRRGGVSDTLAWLNMPVPQEMGSGQNITRIASPFAPQDAWALLPGGSVLVVRAKDYHIDIVHPGGRTISRVPMGAPAVPITSSDMERVPPELRSSLPRTRQPFDTFLIWNDVGEVWIPRVAADGEANVYDVINAAGSLVHRVRMPSGQRVVGLTTARVYTASEDANGFVVLQAYAHW